MSTFQEGPAECVEVIGHNTILGSLREVFVEIFCKGAFPTTWLPLDV